MTAGGRNAQTGGGSARASASSATTPEEQRQLEKLKQRDREVRAHEAAHLAAAGSYARGGAQLDYTRGPDGRLYATGGEVAIDSSPVPGDPEATLQKAQTVQRAALAPADPSPQDRRIAAEAAAMAMRARTEMAQQDASSGTESGPTRSGAEGLLERIRGSGALDESTYAGGRFLHLTA